jgi:hypothetical protein
MAIVILSIIAVPVIQAFTLSARADAYTHDIYLSGMLIEGIAAQCRFITSDKLSEFSAEGVNNIWEILSNISENDTDYYCALFIKDGISGETYTFTNDIIPFAYATEPEFEYLQSNPNLGDPPENYYDLVLNEYVPYVYIEPEITESYRICVRVKSEETIEIINESPANVYADIYGSCEVSYKGGQTFVKTRKGGTLGKLYINAQVFAKNEILLHSIALCV